LAVAYSQRLGVLHVPSGEVGFITNNVAGFIWVARSITMFAYGEPGPHYVNLNLQTGSLNYTLYQSPGATYNGEDWVWTNGTPAQHIDDVRWSLYYNESIEVAAFGSDFDVTVHGYQLIDA